MLVETFRICIVLMVSALASTSLSTSSVRYACKLSGDTGSDCSTVWFKR